MKLIDISEPFVQTRHSVSLFGKMSLRLEQNNLNTSLFESIFQQAGKNLHTELLVAFVIPYEDQLMGKFHIDQTEG